MAATGLEYAVTTMMAPVRLTGTTVESRTAAETTSRLTGTADRYTRSPLAMVADGASGLARYGFRCNRQREGGSPALLTRPVLSVWRGASTRAGCGPRFAESSHCIQFCSMPAPADTARANATTAVRWAMPFAIPGPCRKRAGLATDHALPSLLLARACRRWHRYIEE